MPNAVEEELNRKNEDKMSNNEIVDLNHHTIELNIYNQNMQTTKPSLLLDNKKWLNNLWYCFSESSTKTFNEITNEMKIIADKLHPTLLSRLTNDIHRRIKYQYRYTFFIVKYLHLELDFQISLLSIYFFFDQHFMMITLGDLVLMS